MIPTPDLSHLAAKDYEHVYEPAEDTFLLLDALEEDEKELKDLHPSISLEIGSAASNIYHSKTSLKVALQFRIRLRFRIRRKNPWAICTCVARLLNLLHAWYQHTSSIPLHRHKSTRMHMYTCDWDSKQSLSTISFRLRA